jgi:Holliday junction resolvase RusA-like endonuclease
MIYNYKVTRPPTRNQSERFARGNMYKAANVKKEWTYRIAQELLAQGVASFDTKVSMMFIFDYAYESEDCDNIAGCLKYILDGMVKANIIKDDNMKHINKALILGYNKVPQKASKQVSIFISPDTDLIIACAKSLLLN